MLNIFTPKKFDKIKISHDCCGDEGRQLKWEILSMFVGLKGVTSYATEKAEFITRQESVTQLLVSRRSPSVHKKRLARSLTLNWLKKIKWKVFYVCWDAKKKKIIRILKKYYAKKTHWIIEEIENILIIYPW